MYYYRPQQSWGKVMFLQASVILLTGGVPDTHIPQDQVHPPEQTPPGPGTPPRTRYIPPGPGTPCPRDQVHLPRTRYSPLPRSRYTPPDQVHPTPQDQVHPPTQSMLGDTVNTRAVRILLECNLVWIKFSDEKKNNKLNNTGK